MEAEYRANQRIKTLESNISTVQAQKDQLGRLNEQLMRQKLAVEEKLQETKTTTVAHGSQHQDIIFYKNKVRHDVTYVAIVFKLWVVFGFWLR